MMIIRPIAVTDAVLTSSTVPEIAPAAWSNVTTYGAAAAVSVATGLSQDVYVSKWPGNLNHAPASSPDWWTLQGTTWKAYDVAHTYGDGDTVTVVAAETHKLYQSFTDSNTGNAVTDTDHWIDLGADNRWAMLDASVTSQTTNPDSITTVFQVPSRIDSVAVQNVSAAALRIVMTDPLEGVVYDQTFPLVSDSGITTWWGFFNEPIVRLRDKTVIGLPSYGDVALAVTLSDPGAIVRCGACVVGLSLALGGTQWGGSVGIQDYSVKAADDFGNYSVTKRAFAKRGNFTVLVDGGAVDQLVETLSDYRATPILWVANPDYAATAILGFFKDFSVEISYPTLSLCSLEIEGL